MEQDEFLAALGQLSVDCPQTEGAVLATREGLVLAATGCLQGDVSALFALRMGDAINTVASC